MNTERIGNLRPNLTPKNLVRAGLALTLGGAALAGARILEERNNAHAAFDSPTETSPRTTEVFTLSETLLPTPTQEPPKLEADLSGLPEPLEAEISKIEISELLEEARSLGQLVSRIDPGNYAMALPRLGELGSESRGWWILESGGYLLTRATFLGSTTEKITDENEQELGRVLLLAFTREDEKVLWVVGALDTENINIPLALGEKDPTGESPFSSFDIEAAIETLTVGKDYLLDLWPTNAFEGWEEFNSPQDILDFFAQEGYPKHEAVRRSVLFSFLLPATFASGFPSDYTIENVRTGNVSVHRALPLNHLIEVDSGLIDVPFW